MQAVWRQTKPFTALGVVLRISKYISISLLRYANLPTIFVSLEGCFPVSFPVGNMISDPYFGFVEFAKAICIIFPFQSDVTEAVADSFKRNVVDSIVSAIFMWIV